MSVQLYQRSSDVFLGLPFNIASTALLLSLICHYVERTPGRVLIQIGDVHIYEEHVDVCKQQLTRSVHPLPKINIVRKNCDLLWAVLPEELTLINYTCENPLRAVMKS